MPAAERWREISKRPKRSGGEITSAGRDTLWESSLITANTSSLEEEESVFTDDAATGETENQTTDEELRPYAAGLLEEQRDGNGSASE